MTFKPGATEERGREGEKNAKALSLCLPGEAPPREAFIYFVLYLSPSLPLSLSLNLLARATNTRTQKQFGSGLANRMNFRFFIFNT